MIRLKSDEEIEILRENAILVSKTLAEVGKAIAPGVKTITLDKLAETFIRDNGAIPGFLGYGGFPYTLCISVNDFVVHGFPGDYELKEGDIVSVDCGTIYKGFYGDSAYTFPVGEISAEAANLLKVTKESLYLGAEKAIAGNRLGDIGSTVQQYAEKHGFSVVREMVGHGIGTNMHESPEVPNYGTAGRGPRLLRGMTLAIEPMVNSGAAAIRQLSDGWTVKTQDGSLSAHYENSILITEGEAEVLTTVEEPAHD